MKNKKTIVFVELFLILSISISFAYLTSQTNNYFTNYGESEEGKGIKIARQFLLDWLDNGLVSAQGTGLWTCLENINGTACQEYPSETCNSQCTTECFPGKRSEYSECRLGTCLDNNEGTCSPNTPQTTCVDSGGEWFEQAPAVCNPGCCIIGDQTRYTTEGTCSVLSDKTGIETEWKTVSNELECLALARQQEEGACVLEYVDEENGYNCKFGTKSQCLSLGGQFNSGLLCSNSELNTICTRQEGTSCVDGKNEVYWIDSCGNRENIYDSNRIRSWNGGEILTKEDSCSLETGSNSLGNQRTCGNCEYLLGSICGEPGEKDRKPVIGELVCKDLSCIEENGNERKNGESWCAFDSSIGVDNENKANLERSVDVPGSRHYRQVCLDGEIRTEPCADFRGEVCVENREESIDFSSAACRINQWQLCLDANTEQEKLDKCEENTDCSLHRIALDKFEFDVCTPKYPPGFDLRAELGGEVGEQVCSFASQTCTVVEVKGFGGWKCEANCECLDEEFAETMNNLCISLGDCGGHVNLAGKYSDDGYRVYEDEDLGEKVSSGYIDNLKKFAEPKEGQAVKSLSNKELAALFGVPEATFSNDADFAEFLGKFGLGASGAYIAPFLLAGKPIGAIGSFAYAGNLGAFANAAGGLAVGAAIGYLIGTVLGLEGDGLNFAVLGGITGSAVGGFLVGGSGLAPFLIGGLIGGLLFAGIAYAFGLGDTREIEVKFECNAWQPPTGGKDCALCDKDPLGCSKYKCQSFGQACQFINEGTGEEACVNVAVDDSSSPIVEFDEGALKDKYSAEERENGVIVQIDEGDGCIAEFTPVPIGIKLNEQGQCKIESVHTTNYGEMTSFFGSSTLYKDKHGMIAMMPPLVDGVGPDRREDYNLYVRCQDYSGNANIQEFNINFCVKPGKDLTAPIINKFIPEEGYAALGAENKSIQFYTNEPADCRWSLTDKTYEEMSDSIFCSNAIRAGTIDGWLCSTILPITNQDEQNYYFRCQDQPWLSEDDDEENDRRRNSNSESTIYTIKKTKNDLIITSVKPKDETINSGTQPVSVNLEVKTSGGVNNGKAVCEYSFNEEGGLFTRFFETSGTTHKQKFTTLFAGEYNIALMCKDVAGNIARGNTEFDIFVDNIGPEITRAYQQPQGTLNIITNEPAECRYSLETCGFIFDDGTLMSGSSYSHTIRIDEGGAYYIKCQDDYGNAGSCLTFRGGY